MSKPNWKEIQEEWETTKKTYKELEEQFNVKSSTIRSRKNREKWERNATENATQQKKSVATKKGASVANNKKRTTSNKRKKRSGNPNPKNQFTKRNNAAVTHGLFAKYINDEQREIIDEMQSLTLADQLYTQIEIKFSAIIRLQKIMWVSTDDDHLDMTSSISDTLEGESESYKVIYAHERYESYIRAQSRAMAEYRNLVKQFLEMAHDEDERKLKLEHMQTSIDKNNAEIDKLNKENTTDAPPEIVIVDEWTDADG